MKPTSRNNGHLRSDDGQTHRHTHFKSTYRLGPSGRMGRVEKSLSSIPILSFYTSGAQILLSLGPLLVCETGLPLVSQREYTTQHQWASEWETFVCQVYNSASEIQSLFTWSKISDLLFVALVASSISRFLQERKKYILHNLCAGKSHVVLIFEKIAVAYWWTVKIAIKGRDT